MDHILRGMRLVYGERRLRPYVWGPMAFAAGLFVLITILAYFWLTPWVQEWLGRVGIDRAYGALIGGVAFFIVWWLLSMTLYLGLAGILSSFLWERLSVEIERMEGALTAEPSKVGCGGTAYDTILRTGLSLLIAVLTLATGWLCFGVVGIFLAGFLGLLDYSSCAFARRGVLVDRQWSAVRRCPGWKGFLIGSGFVALFPFVNVLMLPALVAGGTLLCLKGEQKVLR